MAACNPHHLLCVKGARIERKRHSGTAFELFVPEFCLEKGQMVCVVGESGCGKSTLLDFLALVLRPKELLHFSFNPDGISIDLASLIKSQRDSDLAKIRRLHLGYVLQTGGLLPFLTVRENLALPARLCDQDDFDSRVNLLARKIGIYKLLDEKPKGISGGQRQRAAILRAMIHRPKIIFADEPTAAVDKKRALEIIQQFKDLAMDDGVSIVMVTHDQALVENVADRWFGFNLKYPRQGLIQSECHEIRL